MKSNNLLLFIVVITVVIIILLPPCKSLYDNFQNNWNDKIDGVVYINLEKRDDRKKLLLEELKKIQVNNDKINKVSGVYTPKNGHKGCVQSHILALSMAKMNRWKYALILEDDAELNVTPEEFNSNVNNAMEYLSSNNINWNIIMLATAYSRKETVANNRIVNRVMKATTSSGYIINQNYYDTLIDLFKYCNDNMTKDKWSGGDSWEPYALDQQWAKLQEKDLWYGFAFDLIKQRNISSSIMGER